MSEQTESTKELDFGDYCIIEQKRYGVPNEHYQYKVIGRLESNTYRTVPVDARCADEFRGKEIVPVIRAICCGLLETRVETFRVADVRPLGSKALPADWRGGK